MICHPCAKFTICHHLHPWHQMVTKNGTIFFGLFNWRSIRGEKSKLKVACFWYSEKEKLFQLESKRAKRKKNCDEDLKNFSMYNLSLSLSKEKSTFTQHTKSKCEWVEKKPFQFYVCTLLTTKLLPIISWCLVLACLTSIVSIALNQGYIITSVQLVSKSNLPFTKLEELQVVRVG